MTNTTALVPAILRRIYRIEEAQDVGERIDNALIASSKRLVDVLAKGPVAVHGFEEPQR